jgi:hypothetical protein
MTDAAARQRQAYEAMLNGDTGLFTTGVPVLFSPADAVQDEANVKGGYGRFAQILLPLEYGSWADEAQGSGQEFGIQMLGFRSQPVRHIEAGIATNGPAVQARHDRRELGAGRRVRRLLPQARRAGLGAWLPARS